MIGQTLPEPAGAPQENYCPVEAAVREIGGKWKLLIIRLLLYEGPSRFNRLLESVEGISSKVLTQDLRALTEAAIVERRVLSARPQRVEYALTPVGEELLPIFKSLGDWRERLGAAQGG